MNWPSFHLWLKPSGAASLRFSQAIAQLSRELGGPLFEPHLTLTSDLAETEMELVKRTETLASQLVAFDIILEEIAFGTEYFRCVYAHARLTPALARARELSRQAFGQPSAPFLPHLSLAYGDYDPARKAAAMAELHAQPLGSFRAHALVLIRSEGPDPATWQELRAAPLTK